MLLAALKLQLAALVTVAGVNTDDITSKDVKSALETLAKAQTETAPDKGGDINKAVNEAVEAIKKAATADDADANYTLALWARQGIVNGLDAATVLAMYQKAAKSNVPAKAELGALYLQNFPQDSAKVKEGVDLITAAEAAGNAGARRALAQLTLQGVGGIERSVEKAVKLLEKGSEAKDGAATYNLAQIYAAGVSERQADGSTKELLPKSEEKALANLKKAAIDQEFAPAMSDYATRLFQGDDEKGTNKNPKAAMDMFTKAAEKGNAAANRQLGVIYETGVGEQTKSIDKAFEHYMLAARGSDGVAQLWMGNVTQSGLVKDAAAAKIAAAQKDGKKPDLKAEDVLVAPNPAQALSWYRLAAQNNLPQAIFNVGVFYENGAVVDKDLNKAFQLVQKAAISGIPQAMFRLAGYYQQGAGVAQDPIAAAGWFERSAKAGLPQGKLVYGIMLENGSGVDQSIPAAAKFYEEAADAGLPQAMINLAQLYERGPSGFPKDLSKAYVMASLAYEVSNKDANAEKYREELGKKLSKDELAKATKSAEDKFADMKKRAAGGAPTAEAAPTTKPAPAPSESAPKKKGVK